MVNILFRECIILKWEDKIFIVSFFVCPDMPCLTKTSKTILSNKRHGANLDKTVKQFA